MHSAKFYYLLHIASIIVSAPLFLLGILVIGTLIDPNSYDKFDMLEGERIIFPSTPGYFWKFEEGFKDESPWGYKYSGSVLDVIVTNRRIMVGRIMGFSLSRFGFTVFTDEVFNKENYWHLQSDKILGNETDSINWNRIQGVITGDKKASHNKRLRSISYAEDESLGPYIKIERDTVYQTMKTVFIFHPKAEGIYRIFSSPLNDEKKS